MTDTRAICPRCRSSRIDNSLRVDPVTLALIKCCRCDQCGHQFSRSEGVSEAMKGTNTRGTGE
jgi:predicted Zn-ribbon and HTH transcriptional regulator